MIQLARFLGALWLAGSTVIGAMAISAYFFANIRNPRERGKTKLTERIMMVAFWPLSLFSHEGRKFLSNIWKGQL